MWLVDIFRAKIVDISEHPLTIEVTAMRSFFIGWFHVLSIVSHGLSYNFNLCLMLNIHMDASDSPVVLLLLLLIRIFFFYYHGLSEYKDE